MTYDNAAAFDINKTDNQAWYIQLKQNGVELEKDQWYKLSLDAKSTMNRKLMFAIQRDGSKHNDDWTPYSGEEKVDLTSEWQTFELPFQMTNETDLESVLSISMGAVDGVAVNEKHSVYIDNIVLEKIEAPEIEEIPVGDNLLKNTEFANKGASWEMGITSPATGDITCGDGKVTFALTNVGTEDWHAQLKQMGLLLENGQTYKVSFKAQSTEARIIKANVMNASYAWYGGTTVALEQDVEQVVSFEVKMNTTDRNCGLFVSMGQMYDDTTKEAIDTPASTITLSDLEIVKVGGDATVTPEVPEVSENTNLIVNGRFDEGFKAWNESGIFNEGGSAKGTAEVVDGKAVINITDVGTEDWHVQLIQKGLTLEEGASYKVSFEVTSTENRVIKYVMQTSGYAWYGGNDRVEVNGKTTVNDTITINNATSDDIQFVISMGQMYENVVYGPNGIESRDEVETPASIITIDNIALVKLAETEEPNEGGEATIEPSEPVEGEMIANGDFANDFEGWATHIQTSEAMGNYSVTEGKAVFTIENVGTAGWHVHLKKSGIALEQGATYKLSFDIVADNGRTVKYVLQDPTDDKYTWYAGDELTLVENENRKVENIFTVSNASSDAIEFQLEMGNSGTNPRPATITIDNISLVKVSEEPEATTFGLRRSVEEETTIEETVVEETSEEATTEETTEESTDETSNTEETTEESGETVQEDIIVDKEEEEETETTEESIEESSEESESVEEV